MDNKYNLQDLDEKLSQVKLERDRAVAWAMHYENYIRYTYGNDVLSRLRSQANLELPRIMNEAWNPIMVKRFFKLGKTDTEL